jgi:hypothetical protein
VGSAGQFFTYPAEAEGRMWAVQREVYGTLAVGKTIILRMGVWMCEQR